MINIEKQNAVTELDDCGLARVSGGTLGQHTSDSDSLLKYAILNGAYKGIEKATYPENHHYS